MINYQNIAKSIIENYDRVVLIETNEMAYDFSDLITAMEEQVNNTNGEEYRYVDMRSLSTVNYRNVSTLLNNDRCNYIILTRNYRIKNCKTIYKTPISHSTHYNSDLVLRIIRNRIICDRDRYTICIRDLNSSEDTNLMKH